MLNADVATSSWRGALPLVWMRRVVCVWVAEPASRHVGQVGSRRDAEQGQRWRQAGYGRYRESTKMVRHIVTFRPIHYSRQQQHNEWGRRET